MKYLYLDEEFIVIYVKLNDRMDLVVFIEY